MESQPMALSNYLRNVCKSFNAKFSNMIEGDDRNSK